MIWKLLLKVIGASLASFGCGYIFGVEAVIVYHAVFEDLQWLVTGNLYADIAVMVLSFYGLIRFTIQGWRWNRAIRNHTKGNKSEFLA